MKENIKQFKDFEIYETEKLINNISNMESILLNSTVNQILSNQLLDLKGAVLDGDQEIVSVIIDQISLSVE